MNESMSTSVVVPVYNSAGTLADLVDRIRAALGELPYEIVFVDDGSTDASWPRICALADDDSHVRGIRLARNFGQHNALLAGIRAVRGAVVVTLDDDLQQPPEEIPKLLARLDGDVDVDVVYGTPISQPHGLVRNLVTRVVKLGLRGAMGSDAASQVTPFRAFRAELRDGFAGFEAPYVSIDVLLSWATTRFVHVDVASAPRAQGRSAYTVAKLASYTLTMLTGFSTRPLRIATTIGLFSTVVGFGMFAFVLLRYFLEGERVAGFAFLASTITLFSGTQLLTLGVIGEYVARIHMRVLDRPSYSVREETTGTGILTASGTGTASASRSLPQQEVERPTD